MKIMFYSQHVLGVGHFFRSMEIAGALHRHEVLFVEGGDPVPGFTSPGHVKRLFLPPLMMDSEFRTMETRGGSLDEIRAYVERDATFRTVIVDEAHRFRNQNTEDYDDLLQTCRGKEVILLTATPFNNRPADLLSLLKLFLPPKKCPLVLDGNMEADFWDYNETFRMIGFVLKNMKTAEKYEEVCRMLKKLGIALTPEEGNFKKIKKELGTRSAEVARKMRGIIEPVTIRRNRLDLKGNPDYAREITTLSTVCPPAEQFYFLSEVPINLNIVHVLILNAVAFVVGMAMLVVPSMVVSHISPDRTLKFD